MTDYTMDDYSIHTVEDYKQYIGSKKVKEILKKAEPLKSCHVVHINSTYYGGGVAEILSSLSLLMNSVGLRTEWRVIQGSPDFFSVTKKIHNALQGGEINLTERKIEIYERVIYENSVRNVLDYHDFVVIHDPQPLCMIHHYKKTCPWIWRCHVDLSSPHKKLWEYMVPTVERYDAVIFSIEEYKKRLKTPQLFFMPAIDPFRLKNKELTDKEIQERLDHYNIPTDWPLVVQVSRFDRWKDPEGVIEAYKLARKETDCTLVLLGNTATDDPEGQQVYESLLESQEERIIVLSVQDSVLVNALQRKAAVVVQKSIKEGFGLTVTEAMWKGAAVVGSNVGGIKYQIKDGYNGFLVSSIEETAERIVQLIKRPSLRRRLGRNARKTVKERFLLPRLLEQYLEMFGSFETEFKLKMR